METRKPFTGVTSGFMVPCRFLVEDGKIVGLEANDLTAEYTIYEVTRGVHGHLTMQRTTTTAGGSTTMVMSGTPASFLTDLLS